MAEQDTSLSFQQLSVIDLLKSHIQSQKDAIKTLENKAQHNFNIINIIAAIVAALNLDLGDTYNVRQILSERPLLFLIFVGYAVVVVLSFQALTLRTQATEPMTVSLKNAQDWSNCDLEHHYDILMKSYLQIYDHNENIVKLIGRRVQWAHTTIAIVIGLIFLEASGLYPEFSAWLENLINQLPR